VQLLPPLPVFKTACSKPVLAYISPVLVYYLRKTKPKHLARSNQEKKAKDVVLTALNPGCPILVHQTASGLFVCDTSFRHAVVAANRDLSFHEQFTSAAESFVAVLPCMATQNLAIKLRVGRLAQRRSLHLA